MSVKLNLSQLKAAQTRVRAIAHPHRVKIVEYLNENPGSTVNAVYHHFGWEQSVTSQHLKTLRDAGLVTFRTAGKERLYSVHASNLSAVLQATEQLV